MGKRNSKMREEGGDRSAPNPPILGGPNRKYHWIKVVIMTPTIDIGTLITTTTGLHGGCPHIIGKGITVRRIVTWYKRGLNAEEICDGLRPTGGHRIGTLTLAEVYAALVYYHSNTEAIETDLASQAAEGDRLGKLHVLDFFKNIHRQGPFRTSEEIDRDLQEERNSWDS
jgi:uncharacterized protein (DUF433 family)